MTPESFSAPQYNSKGQCCVPEVTYINPGGHGDLFSNPPYQGGYATHRTMLLVTAPISATNGIEDRHKKDRGFKKPCSVGLLSYLQYFGVLRCYQRP